MTVARLRNLTTGSVVAENVENARTWWRRMSGLLGNSKVSPDEGLWFDNCSAIHTIGMRSKIDAIFLDGAQRVVDVRHSVPPNRFIVRHVRARAVVELGAAEGVRNINAGDRLSLE